MTLGWVDIVVDGQPAQVRICYVRAWDDPKWLQVNKLPERRRKDGRRRCIPTLDVDAVPA